ncbi:CHAT domain-containing protein [bacterium]|nr:CHAT domain-containing protein [bacterium]MCI0605729.1 CHAT domain-containing protein [bacterium]
MVTIMIIQANPRTEIFLNLKDEYLKVEQALRAVHAPEHKIVWESGVRPGDLLPRLREHKPAIVHFSGHADPTGEILFEDKDGNTEPIPTDHLRDMFAAAAETVKLVVLNSCFSDAQARAIAETTPVVIGTTTEMPDECSLRFSELFYAELGRGHSVQRAMEIVKSDLPLRNEGIDRILNIHQRARDSASKLKLFLRPQIKAAFQPDECSVNLKMNGDQYCIFLWIENSPDDTIEAVYEFNRALPISSTKVSYKDSPDFRVSIDADADFQIRTTLWSRNGGQCLISTLSEALKLAHSRERDPWIKAIIEKFSRN